MRRVLPMVLAACLLTGSPACSLLNQTAATAQEAADALRDAATALQLLDALSSGYLAGTDLPSPEELRIAGDVVDDLEAARRSLLLTRSNIKAGRIFDAAETLEASLISMDSAVTGLEKLGVDVSAAKDAMVQAHLLLDHLR